MRVGWGVEGEGKVDSRRGRWTWNGLGGGGGGSEGRCGGVGA